jgi:hypothetical protein
MKIIKQRAAPSFSSCCATGRNIFEKSPCWLKSVIVGPMLLSSGLFVTFGVLSSNREEITLLTDNVTAPEEFISEEPLFTKNTAVEKSVVNYGDQVFLLNHNLDSRWLSGGHVVVETKVS